MHIILSGGGTLGSVSPLIAVWQELKATELQHQFLWVGTKNGPEIELVSNYKISYKPIYAGKWRRYFSVNNFFDPFLILLGFFQSLLIISKYKPSIIISAGGFVSVPLVWAGWLLKIPCLIHQQDAQVGLANKLMAPFSKAITVTFQDSLKSFSKKKVYLTGNPVRKDVIDGDDKKGYEIFHFDKNLPVIVVIGGGTGALIINKLLIEALPYLVSFCQVIHFTGRGKMDVVAEHSHYRSYEFLTQDLKHAYAIATIVVCRAGMSTLTELAYLRKPMIIIPIPNSHQEANAIIYARDNAAIVLDQNSLDKDIFIKEIKNLLEDVATLNNLARNVGKVMPYDANQNIIKIINKIAKY